MSHLSSMVRGSLAAVALISLTAPGARAQQLIPDIIISSTIPGNGDLNPYGMALVPPGFPTDGPLAPGDVLVSNFNNSFNSTGRARAYCAGSPAE